MVEFPSCPITHRGRKRKRNKLPYRISIKTMVIFCQSEISPFAKVSKLTTVVYSVSNLLSTHKTVSAHPEMVLFVTGL